MKVVSNENNLLSLDGKAISNKIN